MRVVVVGANGFIGVNLIKRLLKCQYDVIGIDQYDNHLQMFLDNSSFKLIKEQVSYDVLMNVHLGHSVQYTAYQHDDA